VKCNFKIVSILTLISAIAACSARADFPNDERFLPWRIGVAIPWVYVSGVTEAYGVNEKNDWTSLMLPYSQLLLSDSRRNINYIREDLQRQDYEGYGIALGHSDFTPNQIGLGYKTLPDELYLYWNSSFTNRHYATVVKVTPQIKAAMKKPYPHPSWRFEGQNCYQTTFKFGLLPDGRAKLWLEGCNIYTYVGVFAPARSELRSPNWTKETSSAYQAAKQEGLTIEPIPWEKVDKVWYNEQRDTMQTLEEALR